MSINPRQASQQSGVIKIDIFIVTEIDLNTKQNVGTTIDSDNSVA